MKEERAWPSIRSFFNAESPAVRIDDRMPNNLSIRKHPFLAVFFGWAASPMGLTRLVFSIMCCGACKMPLCASSAYLYAGPDAAALASCKLLFGHAV